ncbi:MAG: GspE/PulE family protein [Patescibacteria group bacterium]
MSLVSYLVQERIIDEMDATRIEEDAQTKGSSIDEAVIDAGVDPDVLFTAKQKFFSDYEVRYQESKDMVPPEVLEYVPENSARLYGFVPLAIRDGDILEVGILDPDNLSAKSALEFIAGAEGISYELYLISYDYYSFIIENYSGLKGEVQEALGALEAEQQSYAAKVSKRKNYQDIDETERITEDAPITKIVSNILKHAAETRTSDVHIEPLSGQTDVRYRIDGLLQKDLTLPKSIHEAVIARIKILSKIKLDEKRIPQDGRFSAKLLGRKIDFRVSTFPTYYGEKCVMRLLESDRGTLNIHELGLVGENAEKMKRIITKPYGIILVCGPTGSGKTTSLYSFLDELDKQTVNVVSLENPIEMNIEGVSQSQVRPDIGYTFANGLRSVLRQDPDIIMVGEIRDTETAQLAIQAALTGHLVFSTIHTNTASDVVQRLVDMGVEQYLIGPTIVAAIGQRLVRTIAPNSGKEVPMSPAVREMIRHQISDLPKEVQAQFTSQDTMYEAVPSDAYPTGESGRIGVFEILEMNPELERLVLKDPSSRAIYDEARKHGFITFKEDAILKALEGRITFEQVMKL